MSELIEVGYTKKPKGIEGYLKLHVEDDYIHDVSKARALFIDLDGSQVPFLIEKFVVDGQLMVKLDEVNTPQMASLYCAKTIFLHTDEVTYSPQTDNEKSFLEGFTILDLDQIRRGTIVAILEYPNQIMAEVDNGGLEPFLLPIHEDHIVSIDEANKVVNMDVPEGIDDLS